MLPGLLAFKKPKNTKINAKQKNAKTKTKKVSNKNKQWKKCCKRKNVFFVTQDTASLQTQYLNKIDMICLSAMAWAPIVYLFRDGLI